MTGNHYPRTYKNIAKCVSTFLLGTYTPLLLSASFPAAMAKPHESGGDATAKLSAGNSKVKLMCSYGGKIQPRPRDQQLVYVGGDTKLLTVDRNIKFSDVVAKLNSLYNFNSEEVCLKYQLPGEDLDVLISLINDDDLENMMFEYDRLQDKVSPSSKPARFRLFLSGLANPTKLSSDSGSEAPLNPDYLFGFDKEYDYSSTNNLNSALTTPAFDLGLWTIPSMVVPGKSGSVTVKENGDGKRNGIEAQKAGSVHSHVAGEGECAAMAQLHYRVPMASSGFHVTQYGVVPVSVVNGFRERRVYNLVSSVPVVPVPGQMRIAVSTVDRSCQKRNV